MKLYLLNHVWETITETKIEYANEIANISKEDFQKLYNSNPMKLNDHLCESEFIYEDCLKSYLNLGYTLD